MRGLMIVGKRADGVPFSYTLPRYMSPSRLFALCVDVRRMGLVRSIDTPQFDDNQQLTHVRFDHEEKSSEAHQAH